MKSIEKQILNLEIKSEWINKFNDLCASHLDYFTKIATYLGVTKDQIKDHDISKTSFLESRLYIRRFGGGINEDLFKIARLNHIHKNPHHWEYWISYTKEKIIPIEIPKTYMLEMLANWISYYKMNKENTELTLWLNQKIEKSIIHNKTKNKLLTIITGLNNV